MGYMRLKDETQEALDDRVFRLVSLPGFGFRGAI